MITVLKNVVKNERALFEYIERITDCEQNGFNDFYCFLGGCLQNLDQASDWLDIQHLRENLGDTALKCVA